MTIEQQLPGHDHQEAVKLFFAAIGNDVCVDGGPCNPGPDCPDCCPHQEKPPRNILNGARIHVPANIMDMVRPRRRNV